MTSIPMIMPRSIRVSTYYRGMVYQREETLPQNMVTTLFDRLVHRARLEIKRMIQEALEDHDLEYDESL